MADLNDKIAIVTGAAGGLGRATAVTLAANGAHVWLCDINGEACRKVAAEIGASARSFRLDVSNEQQWQDLIAKVTDRDGGLDILVNNAAVMLAGDIETATLAQWERTLAIDATGTFLGCKHAIATMRAYRGGSIVNVSSIASLRGNTLSIAYGAAKAAIESITRSVALHARNHDYPVRCNSVHPGPIDTPMVGNVTVSVPGGGATASHKAPAGVIHSLAPPEEIADTILFLASDASRGINGARLVVDRGRTCVPT